MSVVPTNDNIDVPEVIKKQADRIAELENNLKAKEERVCELEEGIRKFAVDSSMLRSIPKLLKLVGIESKK